MLILNLSIDKNYLVSQEAYKQFGWVCSVCHFDDVNVPSNLMKKGAKWLKDNQFEQVVLKLKALDLSLMNTNYESIFLGDKIRCIAKPYGMDRLFPVLKLSIPLDKPTDASFELGDVKQKGYIDLIQKSYASLKEEAETNRKIVNSKIKSAVDDLTAKMNTNQGGYKLTEYDEQGRWLRDLYMDTMDKNTATKVLQVNLNGIGGSKNGYNGPFNVGMTLDGQILGERIVANSITAEKLAISYTSQVEKNISEAKDSAINISNTATDNKLKNYYTMSQVDTRLSATDGRIEASVETLTQNLLQKNGNYYGGYIPSNNNAPANGWNMDSLKKLHNGDFFFDTSTGYAYRYVIEQDVYKIVFSEDSRTESANYDYVRFYYQINGKTYVTQNYGGNTIADVSVYIPTNVFWIYWRTDSSNHNYYGFKIKSIEKVKYAYTENGSVSDIPSDLGAPIDIKANTYPESEHSPYKDNERKLWKYTGETLMKGISASWKRIKDSDIDKNNESFNLALKDKSGNYYGDYVPTTSNAPANEWNTDEKRDNHIGDMFYNTLTGYAYRYVTTRQCLKVSFSSDSRTEGESWDYVQIYYELDGKTYALPRLGGNSIKNAVVYVPATNFYVYWRTDSSNSNYYGFKITKIEKISDYQEVKGVIATMPKDGGTVINLSDNNYPESEHSSYGDNVRKIWKYTSNESLSTSKSAKWIRVQDQDIAIAKTKAEEAISRITVAEGSITSMVKKGEFGTFMRQNYNSFLLGFNESSKYVQIKSGEIGLYNGVINDKNKRAVFDERGTHFHRDGYKVGKIGTNVWKDNSSHKGLVFDLDPGGKYMAFSQQEKESDTSYSTMLCFSRANSIYDEYGIHLGCNLHTHGFKILNPQWETGYGVTATMNFVQILDINSDGSVARWGANGRMVFRNGILMDLNYYG